MTDISFPLEKMLNVSKTSLKQMLASVLIVKPVLNSGRLARRHCDVVLKSPHPVSLHLAIWRTALAANYFIHYSCCIRSSYYSRRRNCFSPLRSQPPDTRHYDASSLHRGQFQGWGRARRAVRYSRRHYHNPANPGYRDIELAQSQEVWPAYHVHVRHFVSFTRRDLLACLVS